VGTLRHDGDMTDRIDITMSAAHLNGMLEVFHMGHAKPWLYSRSATKPNHVPQPLDASHNPYWSKSCLTLRGLSIAGCTRDGNSVILQGFCDSYRSHFLREWNIMELYHTAWWKDVKGMWKDEASNPFKSFNLCFKTSTIINLSYLVDHPTYNS